MMSVNKFMLLSLNSDTAIRHAECVVTAGHEVHMQVRGVERRNTRLLLVEVQNQIRSFMSSISLPSVRHATPAAGPPASGIIFVV